MWLSALAPFGVIDGGLVSVGLAWMYAAEEYMSEITRQCGDVEAVLLMPMGGNVVPGPCTCRSK